MAEPSLKPEFKPEPISEAVPTEQVISNAAKEVLPSGLEHVRDFLRGEIVGQEDALDKLAGFANQIELGMRGSSEGPLARWVEIGPSGVGKTQSVIRLIEYFLERYPQVKGHAEQLLMKINGAEFQHNHEIAKLIGAPPGYIGSGARGEKGRIEPLFSQTSLNDHTIELPNGRKIFFVLFDEVEKANEALHKLLLGPLDKGDMRTGDNELVSFKNAVIIFTSNLGNEEISKVRRHSVGFAPAATQINSARERSLRINAFKEKFPPELRGRLGGEQNIIVFNSLDKRSFESILEKDRGRIVNNFKSQGCNISIKLTDEAKEWLLSRGTSPDIGARDLAALVDQEIVQRIARASVNPLLNIPSLEFLNGRNFIFDVKDGELTFLEGEKVAEIPEVIDYEKLPGEELWPGFKLDVAPDVLDELHARGLIIEREARTIYFKNARTLSDNQKDNWNIIIGGRQGNVQTDNIYAKIIRKGAGAYEINRIDRKGKQFKDILIGNIYVGSLYLKKMGN